jgi:hypothetical protein
VVHYRWHPLHGRRVRRHYSEDRLAGRFVHVEVAPGVVTVIAAWMLDPVACAGMELGPPRVSVAALADLNQLLIERGSRRCSRGGSNIAQEEHHGEPAQTGTAIHGTRQLSMALDSARLRGMSAVQRAAAVARLADLLMEAAGLVARKRDDDRR